MESLYHIREITLAQTGFTYLDPSEGNEKGLKNLSKLNIFIGENNSGKSRLIRELVSSDFGYHPREYSLDQLNACVEKIKAEIIGFGKKYGINIQKVTVALNKFKRVEQLNGATAFFELYESLMKVIEEMIHSDAYYPSAASPL